MDHIHGLGRFPVTSKQSIRRVFYQAGEETLRALLAAPLLLLLTLVVLQYGNQVVGELGRVGIHFVQIVSVVLAVGVGLLFFAVVKSKSHWRPSIFLICSLLTASIIYYAYIASISVAWVSDFETMWVHATTMVANGDYTVRSIYDQRALPVLVPAVLLFGPNPAVVPFVNMVFLLGIQLAGYDLARRIAGHRAAQGFVVLWTGAMEPILALPISSHDIWGLFFLVIFLWGLRTTRDRFIAGKTVSLISRLFLAFCVLGLALLLTLLNMQRELTPFVILALVLGSFVMALRAKSVRLLTGPTQLIALAALLLYVGISAGLRYCNYMETAAQGTNLAQARIGALGSSLSNGTYRQAQVFRKTFFYQLHGDSRQSLVNAIPLSDMALQPMARWGNILYRAPEQARLGSQTAFYQAQAKSRFVGLITFTRFYNTCFCILIALLGLCAIVPLLRRLDSIDGLTQLALLSALAGSLLLVGESQPRYVFPIWFILPQLIAFFIASPQVLKPEQVGSTSIWGWDITRGLLMLMIIYLLFAFSMRWIYGESSGRILSGWRPTLYDVAEKPPREWFEEAQELSATKVKRESRDRRSFGFGKLALVMKIPVKTRAGGLMVANKRICVGDKRNSLDFFYYMPYQNDGAKGAFTLSVTMNGVQRWSVELPGTSDIIHAHIQDILPIGTCGTLAFNIRTNDGLRNSSWIRASQTDLYFIRLTR